MSSNAHRCWMVLVIGLAAPGCSAGVVAAPPDIGLPPDTLPRYDVPTIEPDQQAAIVDAAIARGNGSCSEAFVLELVGGRAVALGDTSDLTDEFADLCCDPVLETNALDGPQAYFKFAARALQWYRIVLRAPQFSAYMYAFTSAGCDRDQIQADCLSGGATGYAARLTSADAAQAMYLQARADGEIHVAVDSSNPNNAGTFKLEVEEVVVPINRRCAEAVALVFEGGTAVTQGDIGPTFTPDEFPELTCKSGSSTKTMKGPQVYFTFDAEAQARYRVTLRADSAQFIYGYLFSGGCDPAAISADCSSEGVSGGFFGPVQSGKTEEATFDFTAATAAPHFIAVDSTADINIGGFTLTVERLTP